MTESQTEIKPLSQRIEGYDLARAFAVFGMVVVNFEIAMNAGKNGAEWLIALVSLVEGKAAATFVTLAGVGLSLMSRKARESNHGESLKRKQKLLFKRAIFLFVVGLLYTPLWPADILHFYGIYIAIGALMLASSERKLWGAMIAFMVLFVGLFLVFDYEKGWNWETLEYLDFWTKEGLVRHLFFNGFHPVFPWTVFLLLGMWLGRQDLSNPRYRKKVLLGGLGSLAFAEIVSRMLSTFFASPEFGLDEEAIAFLFGTGPMPPMPQYLLAGGGSAVIVITLSIILTEKFASSRWVTPLVMTGQLALTLYVAHVVIGMVSLDLLGRLENQTLVFSVGSSLVFCAGSVLFATLWRRRFKRGPLEWVMRQITGD